MTRDGVRDAIAGRGVLLFPAAVLGIHEGRYELGYGSAAGQTLADQGHGYLDSLGPWMILLVAFGVSNGLGRAIRTLGNDRRDGHRTRLVGLWATTALSLIGLYCAQEWLEGALATGHPGGFAAPFAHGGLWAFVLAPVAALVIVTVLHACTPLVQALAAAATHLKASFGHVTLPGMPPVPAPSFRPHGRAATGRGPPR